MKKHIISIFVTIIFCLMLGSVASASTMIFFDNSNCPPDSFMNSVASVQFNVIGPDDVDAIHFKHNFPGGWLFMPTGDTVTAFDATGGASLAAGLLGTFDQNVILRDWELGDQDAKAYHIPAFTVTSKLVGSDFHYNITAPNCNAVPIPGAVWLLGAGLLGLAVTRRKSA